MAKNIDHQAVWIKTTVFATLMLTAALILIHFVVSWATPLLGRFSGNVQVIAMLLSVWLFCASTLRSLHNIDEDMPNFMAIGSGVVTSIASIVLMSGLLALFYGLTSPGQQLNATFQITKGTVLFFILIGSLVSVTTFMRLRIKNERMGKTIEAGIIIVVLLMIILFSNH